MSCQCVRAPTTWSNWQSTTPTGSAEICVFTWILLQVEFLEIGSIDFKSAGKYFLLEGSQQLHNRHNFFLSMGFDFYPCLWVEENAMFRTWNRSWPHHDRQNHTWDFKMWWFSLKMNFSCGDRSWVASTTKNHEIPMDFGWFMYIYSKLGFSCRSDGKI